MAVPIDYPPRAELRRGRTWMVVGGQQAGFELTARPVRNEPEVPSGDYLVRAAPGQKSVFVGTVEDAAAARPTVVAARISGVA